MSNTQTLCDYCQEKPAVTSCDVCGSQVCAEHKPEYGCKVCGGGETRFE